MLLLRFQHVRMLAELQRDTWKIHQCQKEHICKMGDWKGPTRSICITSPGRSCSDEIGCKGGFNCFLLTRFSVEQETIFDVIREEFSESREIESFTELLGSSDNSDMTTGR